MKEKGYKSKEQLDEEYIFVSSIGNAFNSDYLWSNLNRILKRHNFPHLSVYALRHLFATRCVDVNIPINQIQQYMGHALASTTLDYYVGFDVETNKQEIKKLEAINNIEIMPKKVQGMEALLNC